MLEKGDVRISKILDALALEVEVDAGGGRVEEKEEDEGMELRSVPRGRGGKNPAADPSLMSGEEADDDAETCGDAADTAIEEIILI